MVLTAPLQSCSFAGSDSVALVESKPLDWGRAQALFELGDPLGGYTLKRLNQVGVG